MFTDRGCDWADRGLRRPHSSFCPLPRWQAACPASSSLLPSPHRLSPAARPLPPAGREPLTSSQWPSAPLAPLPSRVLPPPHSPGQGGRQPKPDRQPLPRVIRPHPDLHPRPMSLAGGFWDPTFPNPGSPFLGTGPAPPLRAPISPEAQGHWPFPPPSGTCALLPPRPHPGAPPAPLLGEPPQPQGPATVHPSLTESPSWALCWTRSQAPWTRLVPEGGPRFPGTRPPWGARGSPPPSRPPWLCLLSQRHPSGQVGCALSHEDTRPRGQGSARPPEATPEQRARAAGAQPGPPPRDPSRPCLRGRSQPAVQAHFPGRCCPHPPPGEAGRPALPCKAAARHHLRAASRPGGPS